MDEIIDSISMHEQSNMADVDGVGGVMERDTADGGDAIESRSLAGSKANLASESEGLTRSIQDVNRDDSLGADSKGADVRVWNDTGN